MIATGSGSIISQLTGEHDQISNLGDFVIELYLTDFLSSLILEFMNFVMI